MREPISLRGKKLEKEKYLELCGPGEPSKERGKTCLLGGHLRKHKLPYGEGEI